MGHLDVISLTMTMMIFYLCSHYLWVENVLSLNINPWFNWGFLFFPLEGATELELNSIEAQIECRLPDDYRCSYRIHNGQKLVIPGSVFIQ